MHPTSRSPISAHTPRLHRQPHLVLASTSVYRQRQLETLGLPFIIAAADIDETPYSHETPQSLARRLALAKALKVSRDYPNSAVIGADQVLDFALSPMGKPGNHDRAAQHLARLSGQTVHFHSAVCLVTPRLRQLRVTTCQARFRKLTQNQIEHYLRRERPYDTAGSAKAEGLGIALLEELSSPDPSAIIGLPLIALTAMLINIGMDPLDQHFSGDISSEDT